MAWNPTAVDMAVPGVMLQRRLRRPWLDDRFHLPGKTEVDGRLVAGSALFGAGWGLAGFCPGPAIAALSMGLVPVVLFVAAMAAGMVLHDRAIARTLPR